MTKACLLMTNMSYLTLVASMRMFITHIYNFVEIS